MKATLIAKVDNFDPKWDENLCYLKDAELKNYLEENCRCDEEVLDTEEIFDDVVSSGDGWFITFRDIMCETIFLWKV